MSTREEENESKTNTPSNVGMHIMCESKNMLNKNATENPNL